MEKQPAQSFHTAVDFTVLQKCYLDITTRSVLLLSTVASLLNLSKGIIR